MSEDWKSAASIIKENPALAIIFLIIFPLLGFNVTEFTKSDAYSVEQAKARNEEVSAKLSLLSSKVDEIEVNVHSNSGRSINCERELTHLKERFEDKDSAIFSQLSEVKQQIREMNLKMETLLLYSKGIRKPSLRSSGE